MSWFTRVKNKILGRGSQQYSSVNSEDVEAAGPSNAKQPPPPKKDDFSHLALKKTSWAGALKITKSLLPYFWPKDDPSLRLRVSLCIALIIIARIINVYVPILYKNVLDALPEIFPFWTIFWYGVLMLVQKSLGDIRDTIFQNVSQDATRVISLQTFSHIHKLSLSFHLSKKTGTLLKVVERGTNSVTTLLTLLLFNIAPTIIELFVVCIVLFVGYGIWLSFVAFAATVSYIVFTLIITEWRTKFRRAANQKENEANDICVDSMTNFETIKYFTAESHEAERYDVALRSFFEVSLKSRFSLTLLNFGQGAITTVAITIAMLISARLVHNGGDIGDIVAVNAQLFTPLGWLGTSYRMIMQAITDMEKLIELLETEPEVKDAKGAQVMKLHASPSVEFRNVQFSYGETNLLKGISFSVNPGKSVALVGQSGSGKTTIFRLLCRFYDPQGGSILVDGQDISSLTQESLRAAIGVVPQDTVLFNDTMEYNIGFGDRKASFNEIVAAAQGAQIFDFVQKAPEGWKTIVGERGLRLSGGEKQRVAIARTILKNPPILVLDEATSALDSQTEKEIQRELYEVARGRTTLIIAHRLSTIVNCDEILVLRNGEIMERGNHEDLLAVRGEYARMWYQQLKQEAELLAKPNTDNNNVRIEEILVDPNSGLASPPNIPPSGAGVGHNKQNQNDLNEDEFLSAIRTTPPPPSSITSVSSPVPSSSTSSSLPSSASNEVFSNVYSPTSYNLGEVFQSPTSSTNSNANNTTTNNPNNGSNNELFDFSIE